MLDIEGMTCASCVAKVERALDHVTASTRSRSTSRRAQRPSAAPVGTDPLASAPSGRGYGARPYTTGTDDPAEEERSSAAGWRSRRRSPSRSSCSVRGPRTRARRRSRAGRSRRRSCSGPGWPFFRNAARAARHGTTTMDTLVALGALAAYGYSAWEVFTARPRGVSGGPMTHYFDTAAVIVTLILLGKTLEARARATAGDASRALLSRAATRPTVLDDGRERRSARRAATRA